MDSIILALGPVFVTGLAIQQLLEILDPIVMRLMGDADKKMVLSIISFAAGLILAAGGGLRVLQPLGIDDAGIFDIFITALIVSAGTETFNSILKYLGYAKEGIKGDAAAIKAEVNRDYVANNIMHNIDRRHPVR